MQLPYSPHDLLPIDKPSIEPHKDDSTYFYEKVVKHLIPDMVRMMNNGIPIDLQKVSELEDTVVSVLDKVHDKLRTNDLMLEFLKETSTGIKKQKIKQLEAKKKEPSDFLKEFDPKNKIHRTYLVNTYLKYEGKDDMILPEWSVKDLKKLNQIIASKFIDDLLNKSSEYTKYGNNLITMAMEQLACDKCEAYNKNRIESKIQSLDNSDIITLFNPGSDVQKRNLMKFLGIESENTTKAGNEQWNRNELQRLQKLIDVLLDEKEVNINEE